MTAPLTYTVNAAARRLGIGRNKMRSLIHDKRIPVVMFDGRARVTETAILEFLASLPAEFEPGKAVRS